LALQETLTAVVRLRANRQVAADAGAFRASVKHMLATADQQARQLGYAADDVRLAIYAVVAFLDESVLNSGQPMFAEWPRKPLQDELFGGHIGGEIFFENLRNCLEKFGNPDRIVVGLGPGSYAGTRIAIAAALGLQAASGAELNGLPSLCAMPTEATDYAVVGDARRESFFFALVADRRCIDGPLLCTREELTTRLDRLALPILSAEPLLHFPGVLLMHPSAFVLAQLGRSASADDATPLEPIYLREPHITQPKVA
jgi:tRNA A37 threonylcarbamoyladenosine modification protein TsaB